ncbi:hypothetical protein ACFXGR_28580 [Streptomyces mirabilis]|uniref:hypothetical protein n=1 Tax=Streptomyces mirabilis TaxID=68239 RepID=UPI00369C4053
MRRDPIDGRIWVGRTGAVPGQTECAKKAVAAAGTRRARTTKKRTAARVGPKPPSLAEENRRLFAAQDRIREQVQQRATTAAKRPVVGGS